MKASYLGTIPNCLRLASRGLILAGALITASTGAQAEAGDDAKAILKAMSDFMGSQQTIELTFDSDIEVITPELEKLQFTNSGEVLLSRPDKLRAHRKGGYADVEMVFDGKTVSILGKNLNGYAQLEAPGSVDQLLEAEGGSWCRPAGGGPAPVEVL